MSRSLFRPGALAFLVAAFAFTPSTFAADSPLASSAGLSPRNPRKPALSGLEELKAQAQPRKRTLAQVGDPITGFQLFSTTHLGHTVAVQFQTDGNNFWLIITIDSHIVKLDLGDGDHEVSYGPVTLHVTLTDLVIADKITFHLQVYVKAVLKVTLYDHDVSINKRLLLAKYSPATHPPGVKFHTAMAAKGGSTVTEPMGSVDAFGGSWVVTQGSSFGSGDGQKLPPENWVKTKEVYTFKGGKVIVQAGSNAGAIAEGTYTFNAQTKQGTIDLVSTKTKDRLPGIFKFDKDRLTVVLGDKDRPSSFVFQKSTHTQWQELEQINTGAKRNDAEFDGFWIVTQGSSFGSGDGQKLPPEIWARTKEIYIFRGGRVTVQAGARGEVIAQGTYTFNAQTKRGTIDLRSRKNRDGLPGIFKVDNDRLTIVLGEKERPSSFMFQKSRQMQWQELEQVPR